ncbi:IucA/IucC family protein [Paenibacillus soyae]|uniref:Siderophore biosynthesis protein n=1 Tax=Paenibacillus soyae TaxID=2969249 RepID=A0A9X2SBL3_9BACL|nr:IucA/IucC family protein [Paenibacillus soyae]MCR2807140.1 siderophore biosynthesis protein [Paenibacillus soyae]
MEDGIIARDSLIKKKESAEPGTGTTAARRKVFGKLVEALVLEGVLTADARESCPGGVSIYRLEGMNRQGRPVEYAFAAKRHATFGMLRVIEGAIERRDGLDRREADDLTLFLEETVASAYPEHPILATFAEELEETVRKDAQYGGNSGGQARTADYETADLQEIEALCTDGHPYHPCYKSRIGFSERDNRAFGPEFRPKLRLFWIAVPRGEAMWSARGESDWRDLVCGHLTTQEIERFDRALAARGLKPADYCCLPVHPWQWEQLSAREPGGIRERLVPLGQGEAAYEPQQSIRTLSASGHGGGGQRPDLKLSLGIVNTSSRRILRSHSVVAAPAVSEWLQAILAKDAYLSQEVRLIVLHEYAGITVPSAQGELGAIWRENVRKYLEPGEAAMPFSAIASMGGDGLPIISRWVEEQGAASWFGLLFRRCVLPVVHLLAAHGIVLESHAQNMLLIHRGGVPIRTALRDFHEGVEYYAPFLPAKELVPDFGSIHPAYASGRLGDFFEMSRLEDLSEMMMDALWFMNIGYIVMFLSSRFAVSEEELWDEAAGELLRYRAEFPHLQERFDALHLFTPVCQIEPLVQKRMYGGTRVTPRPAPNPLFEAKIRIESREGHLYASR